MLRLSGGGRCTLSPDRGQVAWAVAAGLEIDGRTLPELSSVYSPRDEEISLAGEGGLEVFVVELPRLD